MSTAKPARRSTAKTRSDFAQIRLSAAALRDLGKDVQLRFATAHVHYVFTGAEPQEVLISEWNNLLAKERFADGTLFELAEPLSTSDTDTTPASEA